MVPALLLPTLTVTGNVYLFLRNLRLCYASSTQTCCYGKTHGSTWYCDDLPDTFRSLSAHLQQIWLDQNFEPMLCSMMRKMRKGKKQSGLLLQELFMQAIIIPQLYLRRRGGGSRSNELFW